MAEHVTRQILDVVKAAVTGLPTTGAEVHEHPSIPIQSDALPALAVVPIEDPDPAILGDTHDGEPWREVRRLHLAVISIAKTPQERDLSRKEVEGAVVTSPALIGERIRFAGCTYPLDKEGEPLYQAITDFEVEHHVSSEDVTTILGTSGP